MKSFDPKSLPVPQLHEYLLGTIAPRPIAWVSTMDDNGNPNLAPFSFFNIFGSNPATLIFSPSRRVRDNSTKDTLRNADLIKECVINICSWETVNQMVLSSADFGSDINEFEKAGLTPLKSEIVKPYRVAEAIAQFECKVQQIISTGEHGGAGQLVICEVVYVHLQDHIIDEQTGKIDPHKVDGIGRLGGLWYTRAKEGLFIVPNPKPTAGIDHLPESIKHSSVLSGSDLAALAMSPDMDQAVKPFSLALHLDVKKLIEQNQISEAWKILKI